MITRSGAWLIAAAALLCAGCAAGPDFKRPQPPQLAAYAAPGVQAAPRFNTAQPMPAQWWTVFRSPALNALVEQALAHNTDIRAARATLRAAAEAYQAQKGGLYPSVEADFMPSRQKPATSSVTTNAANGASLYSLYTVQAGAAYTVDVFGGVRRLVESAQAQLEFEQYELQAACLSITTNLVGAVIQESSLSAQAEALLNQIGLQEALLKISRRRLELGDIALSAFLADQAVLEQDRMNLAALRKQIAAQQDLIIALTGRFPADAPSPHIELSELWLPDTLPLVLPAELVNTRPDVRAAEAQLHAASAQIGVAAAARFPGVTLSADSGSAALAIARLFGAGTGFWTLSSAVAAPLFQGGQLMHRQRQAEALYDQAAAQYQGSVITAVQSVADVLYAMRADEQAHAAAQSAENASQRLMDIGSRQLELGDISYMASIASQQAHEQSAAVLIQARAARYADVVALFQALGGGGAGRDAGGMAVDGNAALPYGGLTPR